MIKSLKTHQNKRTFWLIFMLVLLLLAALPLAAQDDDDELTDEEYCELYPEDCLTDEEYCELYPEDCLTDEEYCDLYPEDCLTDEEYCELYPEDCLTDEEYCELYPEDCEEYFGEYDWGDECLNESDTDCWEYCYEDEDCWDDALWEEMGDNFWDDYDEEYWDDDAYWDGYWDAGSDENFDDEYGEYYGDDEEVDSQYDVAFSKLEGAPTAEHQQLWEAVLKTIPQAWVDRISSFEIISDSETSGYVYVDENDPTKFVLGLNILELEDPAELGHTIIHEFAHVLSLNSEQIDYSQGSSCPALQLDEGCAVPNAYINLFYATFWTGSPSDDFVSDYAKTDVAEDFSESFTAFVLGQQATNPKVAFFENFPELVQLRNQIRGRMSVSG